ncbi:MAG: hypothetical protein SFY95_02870 [Planctomycetota bacterium]|nr:hypothetical protein [Planctomycetota bacterium]
MFKNPAAFSLDVTSEGGGSVGVAEGVARAVAFLRAPAGATHWMNLSARDLRGVSAEIQFTADSINTLLEDAPIGDVLRGQGLEALAERAERQDAGLWRFEALSADEFAQAIVGVLRGHFSLSDPMKLTLRSES